MTTRAGTPGQAASSQVAAPQEGAHHGAETLQAPALRQRRRHQGVELGGPRRGLPHDALEVAAVRRGIALAVDLLARAVAQELLDHRVRRLARELDLVEGLDAGEARAAPPLAAWRLRLSGGRRGGHLA